MRIMRDPRTGLVRLGRAAVEAGGVADVELGSGGQAAGVPCAASRGRLLLVTPLGAIIVDGGDDEPCVARVRAPEGWGRSPEAWAAVAIQGWLARVHPDDVDDALDALRRRHPELSASADVAVWALEAAAVVIRDAAGWSTLEAEEAEIMLTAASPRLAPAG